MRCSRVVLILFLCVLVAFRSDAGRRTSGDIATLKPALAAGGTIDLSKVKTAKAAVFVLLSPECPISQQCTKVLGELSAQYADSNILFYGVFPGDYYTAAEVMEFKKKYGLNFPMIIDAEYKLTGALKGSVTPEVFVTASDYTTLYTGAIDNAYRELGRKNMHTTAHYLADALAEIAAGKEVSNKRSKAIGCYVNKKKS
jgi:hypothetical protein